MTRKTILVLAYSVSPVRGSEYSVGWNYIKEMSKDHNLIVLYGLAGEHMGDVDEVETNPISQSLENVEWIAVRPNWIANSLNIPNRKGFLIYSFYLAYKFWHRQAYKIAIDLVKHRSIDIIHYLCPIGYREPGYLWKIEKPYIWGPVGGIQNRSVKLAIGKSITVAAKITLRNIANTIQYRLSTRVKSAFKRADLVLASTSNIQKMILDTHQTKSLLLAENAITEEMLANQRLVTLAPGNAFSIIWVGSIDERKSLDILLKSLSLIQSASWHLNVIGDGPLKTDCTKLAYTLGINDRITWVGKVNRQAVNQYYHDAHINVVTSMLEGNPTVIWEAMSFGIPTITLDHFGMHDIVCQKCGIKVPVNGNLKSVIDKLSHQLSTLMSRPGLIEKMSQGVLECSQHYTWTHRRKLWSNYYESASKHWLEHQRGN